MLLIDTNILSAVMRDDPEPSVSALLARHAAATLFTSTLCQAETLGGIAVLPAGRLLAFDEAAADAYAVLIALRRRDGRPVATMDLMIAAVAKPERDDRYS